jgi:DNA-directed RNA polymerase subunit L
MSGPTITYNDEKITLYKKSDNPSDDIDFKKVDVKVKIKINKEDENEIKVDLIGRSVDYAISNSIRLVIALYIPVFCFHRTKLKVEKKESGYSNSYNNDKIETIMENCPIYDIEFDEYIMDPETYLPTEVHKTMYSSFIQETYEDIKDIENKSLAGVLINKDGTYGSSDAENNKIPKVLFSLSKINNDPVLTIFATSHDGKLTINGKSSNSYRNKPRIDLFMLRPGESINLTAEAVLGISIINGIYNATTYPVSLEETENHYVIKYATLEQSSPKKIFKKACAILIRKLELLLEFIAGNYRDKITKDQMVEININGEEHTMGNLLSTTLKKSKDISEASYTMKHQLVNNITIQYKLEEKSKLTDPIDALLDVMQYLIDLYSAILDQIGEVQ